jgi:hypothetical protein
VPAARSVRGQRSSQEFRFDGEEGSGEERETEKGERKRKEREGKPAYQIHTDTYRDRGREEYGR